VVAAGRRILFTSVVQLAHREAAQVFVMDANGSSARNRSRNRFDDA
jgi:hypothetical protein